MEQNQKKWPTIKCPHCGYEYTPAEVLYPESLLGKPDSIIRDALGKIIYLEYAEGDEPCQSEKYICDNCDKPFIVEPVITYKVRKETEELDFTETFVSLL
jgi:DNA-directed RNA polymerase subunit RPC12/RpoP